MKYSLIIFDLDGTVLDTLDDLTDSTNYALASAGFPPRSREEVRSFVGNGIRKLIERAVPENTPEGTADEVYRTFTEHYKEHCNDKTRPYDGIPELLRTLTEAGCKTAVVSNKADAPVKLLCERHFHGLLSAVTGEKQGVRRKPAPDSVLHVMETLGVSPEETVYVGDSDVDIQTAANAGTDIISVDWGFRPRGTLEKAGAKIIVSSPGALLDALS